MARQGRRIALAAYLLRHRRRFRGTVVAAVAVAAAMIGLDRAGWLRPQPPEPYRLHGARVREAQAIDAVRLRVRTPWGGEAVVRLLGLAEPPPGAAVAEAEAMAREWMSGQWLRLELPVTTPAGPDRAIPAYVVRTADGQILNEHLLLAGLAVADDECRHPGRRRYRVLQEQAEHDKVGWWRPARR